MRNRCDNEQGVGRRDFLRSGATGAGLALTLAGCGSPERKLLPALIPEDRIIPGTDRWTITACSLCPGACSIRVRTMAGEAQVVRGGREFRQEVLQVKKIEGNPADPFNRGGVCARGQAAPNILYHPDRYRRPMKLEGPRGSGRYVEIPWEEALAILDRELVPLKSAGLYPGLALIAGPSFSRRSHAVSDLVRQAGSELVFELDHPGFQGLREATRRTFGIAALGIPDFRTACPLISFGAPILEAHSAPVAHARALADMRQSRPECRGRFVQVESRFSLSAANADEWVAVRPGYEGDLAFAIAGEILRSGLLDEPGLSGRVRGFESFKAMALGRFGVEQVSSSSGVPPETIRRLAAEFAVGKPGVALAGGSAIAGASGLITAGAVQALNVLVGSAGIQEDWRTVSVPPGGDPRPGLMDFVASFQSALPSIRTLILFDSDPVGSLPRASGFGKSLQSVPFILSFATLPSESSSHADLILPDASFLERWDIARPETAGAAAAVLSQPVVRKLYESRDAADVLSEAIARAIGRLVEEEAPGFMEGFVKSEFARWSAEADGAGDQWDELKRTGVEISGKPIGDPRVADLSWLCDTRPADADVSPDFPFHFLPFPTAQFGFGEAARLPWIQELPDPMTSVVWGSWLELNPATARSHGIEDGDVVRVESRAGAVEVPALVTLPARPDTVAMPFGPGQRSAGRYVPSRGASPWDVLEHKPVNGAGEPAWAATRVRISRTSRRVRLTKLGDDSGPAPAGLMGPGGQRNA